MKVVVLAFALSSLFSCYGCSHLNAETKASAGLMYAARTATAGATSANVDFSTQIKPILEARCQPCHFNGCKVYAKMRFDRAETIKTLGAKLFIRIKDENERRLIKEFLAQK